MKHLSSEEVSRIVTGAFASENEHFRQCPVCAQEVERVRDTFAQFRNSVRDWTDQQDCSDVALRGGRIARLDSSRADRHSPLAWLLAAAALAAAVAVPVYQNSRERDARVQAERDAQLIDDVNAQLARHAPVAMQPLMQLMKNSKTTFRGAAPSNVNGGIQ
jgi:hypothetical protein